MSKDKLQPELQIVEIDKQESRLDKLKDLINKLQDLEIKLENKRHKNAKSSS